MSSTNTKLFHVIKLTKRRSQCMESVSLKKIYQLPNLWISDKGEAYDPDPGHLHVLFYDLSKDDFECKTADFYDCCGENKTLRIADLLLDVSDKGEIKVHNFNKLIKSSGFLWADNSLPIKKAVPPKFLTEISMNHWVISMSWPGQSVIFWANLHHNSAVIMSSYYAM